MSESKTKDINGKEWPNLHSGEWGIIHALSCNKCKEQTHICDMETDTDKGIYQCNKCGGIGKGDE